MHLRAKRHSPLIVFNFSSHYYLQLTFNYFSKYMVFVKALLKNKKKYLVFILVLCR
jgi:hypothetical protein